MKAPSRLVACVAAISFPWPASGQEASPPNTLPPPTGVDLEATGGALAAFGVLSFATSPICKTSVVVPREQGPCLDVSFAVGAPFLAAGISLIVVGAMQHAKYASWIRSHPAVFGLWLSPTAGGTTLGWSSTF
jgi:hypothetical protein